MSDVLEVQDARATGADVNDTELTVHLEDGRSITTPLEWYPRLVFATPDELQNFRLTGGGYGLHWPDLDEDLSVKGMIAGRPSGESGRSLKRWKQEMERRRRNEISGPWESANAASYERDDNSNR
jgi:hypothetical protein